MTIFSQINKLWARMRLHRRRCCFRVNYDNVTIFQLFLFVSSRRRRFRVFKHVNNIRSYVYDKSSSNYFFECEKNILWRISKLITIKRIWNKRIQLNCQRTNKKNIFKITKTIEHANSTILCRKKKKKMKNETDKNPKKQKFF